MSTTRDFSRIHAELTGPKARTWNDPRRKAKESEAAETTQETEEHLQTGRMAALARTTSEFWGPVVLTDLVLGFLLVLAPYPISTGLPGEIVVGLAIISVGAFRAARLRISGGGIIMVTAFLIFGYLVYETHYNHMPWTQRLTKIVILLLVMMTIASGRINIRSLVIGGLAGAAFNIPAFYGHLTSNNYPPYLTGFYADKNVAGMYYALWGVLGMIVLKSRKSQIFLGFISFAAVFLTGSRTSLGALFAAYAWVLFRNRVGVTFRILIAIVGYIGLSYATTNLADNSAFGDRTGDDWYRHQVEAAMNAKADLTPWYGMGLNSGQVHMGTRVQWFHDSYLLAFVEGGYLWLTAILVLYVLIGLGIFDRRLHIPQPLLMAEGGVIVMLICAWKLGEVFITMAGAITLGIAIAYRLGVDARLSSIEAGSEPRQDNSKILELEK